MKRTTGNCLIDGDMPLDWLNAAKPLTGAAREQALVQALRDAIDGFPHGDEKARSLLRELGYKD